MLFHYEVSIEIVPGQATTNANPAVTYSKVQAPIFRVPLHSASREVFSGVLAEVVHQFGYPLFDLRGVNADAVVPKQSVYPSAYVLSNVEAALNVNNFIE